MVRAVMWSGWRAMRLRRRVAAVVAVLGASVAAMASAAPGDAQAFAWKDACSIGVYNNTGSLGGFKPLGSILAQIPPNPYDEAQWDRYGGLSFLGNGFPLGNYAPGVGNGVSFNTIGIPVTWGCSIHPTFKRGNDVFKCDVYAPSSGKNVFQCSPTLPGVVWQKTKDTDDIAGYVVAGPAPNASGPRPPPPAIPKTVPGIPKRVRALFRRGDLRGRGWRPALRQGHFGWLGRILATNEAPASCKDDKVHEPLAKRGGASAFARGSTIAGYEHGVYASRRQSRRRLAAAVSAHSIWCLARLLTSPQFHTRAGFARYSVPGLEGVTLWRVTVRTRSGGRTTRRDYLDVAGLLHGRSNALVMFAKSNELVGNPFERSVVRTVARRLR
jgi:hypothetical protein